MAALGLASGTSLHLILHLGLCYLMYYPAHYSASFVLSAQSVSYLWLHQIIYTLPQRFLQSAIACVYNGFANTPLDLFPIGVRLPLIAPFEITPLVGIPRKKL